MKINFGKMKPIFKNTRYKILEYESKFYLIDMDRDFYGFILFALSWLIPKKAILITQTDADDLINKKTYKPHYSTQVILLMCVIIISNLVLPPFLMKFVEGQFKGGLIISLCILSIFGVLIRIIHSKRDKINYKNREGNQEVLIKLRPQKWTYCFKSLCVYVLFLAVVIIGAFLSTVVEGYWILSFCYTIVIFIFLLTNYLAYNADDYKIEILEVN
ncbi:DUF443 family protein [Listeria fleischmannii]|uniref:DUF443 family protein n=1 Tax=Listeria fleischmannii TaxID=1069827 RepID=UPI000E047956|nr:DUF443 family protein [Listeria fleischmannii]STY35004.1 tandem five-TM protein [Listeria fleischmannii subsp. coloradonensis]